MRLFRPRRSKIVSEAESQKKFLSIVLVFFSATFLYFGYKQLASTNHPSSLKVTSKVLQNMSAEETNFFSGQQDFKPVPLASVDATDVVLYFPAPVSEVVCAGFHESERNEAVTLQPIGRCYMQESTETVNRSISLSRFPVLFVMYSRGRRQTAASAVDVVLKPGTMIRSPVNGIVTKVEPYWLYGKYQDFRIEIQPDGHPELRVVMIHLDNVVIKVGDRVIGGKTEIAKVRKLTNCFDSQVNEYTPEDCDHTHVQVNKYIPEQIPAKK